MLKLLFDKLCNHIIHHDTCIYVPEPLVASEVNLLVPLECTSLEHPLAKALVAVDCFLF